ncbi:beta strand repeat-containing protein [Iningainema tapete]|uniref:Filamentous hemagglutinin N-terminal domain-containing protein n=1 Tax=Iningainema tapete BLCC-T55 TaxID=2748662 RepID=A0A8J7CGK9_9CYAN|nr:filamentous hemagglutinin N-terminal domain-containing protein [Iningainema tapete]MBD2776505.1 filamentous hemagglutinin N-terminal domain-containing protein [Iningainema tapete BLCC-T55]
MTQRHWLSWCWQLGWVGCLGCMSAIAHFSPTRAQSNIVPDNTLGVESSVVTPNVQGLPVEAITGGAVRGANLFHSFREFNVDAGRGAYFFSPNASIQNILARVTGSNRSEILGTLGTFGNSTPNLFLINPNGIIFGPNAGLNVGGSFVGTTANAVQFGNFGNFSADAPVAPSSLLTINPSALLLNQISPGSITNKSTASAGIDPIGNQVTGLRVPDGRSLLLVGGNVNLDGGSLRAYEGRIELAGLATLGSIGLDVAGNNLSLNVPDRVPRADVFLRNGAEVNVRAANSGSIALHFRNVNLAEASKLRTGIGSGLGTPDSRAGDIEINATGETTLSDGSFIANVVQPEATGTGGNININTGSLTLRNDAALSTSTDGKGDSGRVFVQASDTVSLANSTIFSSLEASAVGNSGGIFITADSLTLTDGAQLQSGIIGANALEPGGRGNAGGVNINVGANVTLTGVNQNGLRSGILNQIEAGSVGNGGDINIKAGSLSLTDGAILNTSTNGQGNGGNIIINARDRIDFDGKGNTFSNANTTVQPEAVGKAGDIRVTTGTISLTNGAFLSSSTLGNGDAGKITIDARDTISFDDGSAQSYVFRRGVGKGGDIRVTTGTLSLTNGAQLVTNVGGQGEAGNIIIDARDTVNIDGRVGYAISGLQSSLLTGGEGKAGNIQMTTGSLTVQNGARISTSTDGRGSAGNITLNARDTITFENSSADSEKGSNDVGSGGDIRVSARALFLKNGGQLNANSFGSGNAGSIIINASDLVAFDGVGNNELSSGANSLGGNGNGGDIRVTTGTLLLTNGGQLSSFATAGNAGNITIDARNTVSFDGVGSNGRSSGAFSELLEGKEGKGKGGDIFVTTGSLSLTNGALLVSNTAGQGNAGNITINARDTITLNGTGSNGSSSGLFSSVGSTGVGKGGDIRLTTGSLTVSDGARLVSNTHGQGNGGNITIDVRDRVTFDGVGSNQNSSGAYSTVEPNGVGNAGNINVTTGALSLNNSAQFSAGTFGSGKAGDININASDAITLNSTGSNGRLSGLFSGVGSTDVGKGGDIRVKSGTLSLSNFAQINATTSGRADAGNISVKVDDAVTLTNSSQITTSVASGGLGKAGDIDILADSLLVTDGAQIQSVLFRPTGNLKAAQGRGGNIRVTTTDSITVSGISSTGFSSALITGTGRETTGNAGNITLTTPNFRVSDAAVVNADTSGFGDGGNITINANSFAALNGGQVLTNTYGTGLAGTITLNVKDTLTLAGTDPNFTQRQAEVEQRLRQLGETDQLVDVIGYQGPSSGIFANTAPGSTGFGGSIFIDPRQVSIRDGAKISVNSDGTGNAGNITLLADILTLDNGAEISAQTTSSQGGNINLQLGNILLLRRGSQISTSAGTALKGGDGGNININSQFIVAVPQENSDITANAFLGNGGRVQINTQAIFGIQSRPQLTDLSDITASSSLGVAGVVNINTPDTDALQNSLIELPENIIDANALIANSCVARGNTSSGTFFITGNGGLAERPGNASLSPYPTGTIRSIPSVGEKTTSLTTKNINPNKKISAPIVEAQGIYRLANGDVVLSRECP